MTETPRSPLPGGSRPGGTRPAGGQVATPPPASFIGRYQILEKIGEGGMGSLHLARDPAIDRLVAIKVLRRGFDTEALRERFAREGRAAGRLRHPNIVTIFDVGEHDGDPFIAMEFLAGETVGELIRHGAGLSLSRRLKLLEELCDGLAYAHRAGLVHRDIKPANLMVDAEGILKILDFGIVRVGESGMTQSGVLVGTINYMAPEQVLGTGVDHRSDIFAVGLVAYELLTGQQAFPGTIRDGLLRRIPNAEVEPLAKVAPDLDPDVARIVEQAIQKKPADRYQELARMRNDLARVRQRIEVEEERAAVSAASGSEETALIFEDVTAPGVPMPPLSLGSNLISDAERALSEGNYRFALTMAGRAAAISPQDRTPGTIVARAEAALLERGRASESGRAAAPGTSAVSESGAVPPSTGTAANQRANYLAMAVAFVALLVAGFGVWSQVGSGPQDTQSGAPAAGSRDQVAADPGVSRTPDAPATGSAGPPPVTPAGIADAPSQSPPPPRPTGEGTNPGVEAGGRAAGDRRSPPAGAAPTRNAGRAQRERQQPPAREQQPQKTQEPAEPPPPVLPPAVTVSTPTTLPGTTASAPVRPPPPPAPAEEKAAVARPRDHQADIRSVLARYEAAWEALDFDALRRVWDMPNPAAVRDSMAGMRDYAMEMRIQGITVAPDARSATAVCVVGYRFLGPVGSRITDTETTTFSFAKRGDNWIITGLK